VRVSFSVRLPATASTIQQVSVRLGPSSTATGFLLLDMTAATRLDRVTIEHGIDVPTNPFLQSFALPATLSRRVIFYADAGSTIVIQADFKARPQEVAAADVSVVGLTRTEGCLLIE
jgi:hypothetical protein